jgi:hypothetical protein
MREFKDFMEKPGDMPKAHKLKLLNAYHKHLAGAGHKKMRGKKLYKSIHQHGGSWGSFVNWLGNAGRTVANGFKTAGNFVYKKAIRPAYEYVRDKPVTAISHGLKVAGAVTGLAPLGYAGTALGAVGKAVGKGQKGGAVSRDGKVLMKF